MKPVLDRATARWLELERRGRERGAAKALGRVFRVLPMPVPSRELMARTLAELGLDAGPLRRAAEIPHWAFRWAVSAGLTLSGLMTVLYAPALVSSLGSRAGLNWAVDLGAGVAAAISRRFAAGYTLWDVLARAGNTAAETLATPQVLGLMLVTLIVGLATLRALASLVAVERSSFHA